MEIEEVLCNHHQFIKSFFRLSQDHKIICEEDSTDVDGVKIDSQPWRIQQGAKITDEQREKEWAEVAPCKTKFKIFYKFQGLPCFTPLVNHNSSVYLPLIRKRKESFVYIDLIRLNVFPPRPSLSNFANNAGLQTVSYA